MNKRVPLGAAVAFMFIVAAVTFSITMIYSQRTFNERVNNLKQREGVYDKFSELDRQVRENYIGNVNQQTLMDHVAQGYVQGIGDKYARYISAEEYARMTVTPEESQSVGIGVVASTSPEGFLRIDEVYPDSPAETAGMKAGDLIVRLDDTALTTENALTQLSNIYGLPGTRITMTVRRSGEEFALDMTRRVVITPTVYARMIPETTIAYMHIKEFTANTSDQFNRELDRMLSAGAKSLIFDVRDNKGGLLRQATRILDRIVPAGIIYSAQRKSGEIQEFRSDGNAIDLPIVILTNGATASAAELFAQVLKDYEKGKTVGTLTTGKGVMQDIFQLSDGSAIEMTVAYYNPPVSENYDGIGVVPDFEVIMEGDWSKMDHETDSQLKKAMEVVLAMEKSNENQSEEETTEGTGTETTEAPATTVAP